MRAAWRTSKWCVVYILVTCIAFDWYTLKYPMRDLPFLAHVWTLERFTVYHQKALDSIFILFLNMHVENTHWKKVWSIRGMNHAFHPSKIIRPIYSGVCLFVCLSVVVVFFLTKAQRYFDRQPRPWNHFLTRPNSLLFGCHSLPKVFLESSLEDKTSAPDVFSSSSFIARAHFETSSVMIGFYGYEGWRFK